MRIEIHRTFVESYEIEITAEGEFALWFTQELPTLEGWTDAEIREQFKAEAREIGRALFKDLPVVWVAFDDGGPGVRTDFYRADVSSSELELLVLDRARRQG